MKSLRRIGLIALMLVLLPTVSYSIVNEDKPINLEGSGWKDKLGTRSLSSPFIAYLNGSVLSIQSDQQEYDLTITLTDRETGEEVYSLEVAKEASSYICIPLVGWDSGSYCLTIRNPEAGYVYGYFNL